MDFITYQSGRLFGEKLNLHKTPVHKDLRVLPYFTEHKISGAK